jgi:hypothetical protein
MAAYVVAIINIKDAERYENEYVGIVSRPNSLS